MAPVRHLRGKATRSDLEKVADERRVELVQGEIVDKASPTWGHSDAQSATAAFLRRTFSRKPGGRWPGGWWIGTEVDIEYENGDIFRPDISGWRRERVPEMPRGWPVTIRPDWACEVQSPGTKNRDLVYKLTVLQQHGVPHYWLVDPEAKTLTVLRLEAKGYVIALVAQAGETVRAEPFDALEVRVNVLLGDEDVDE